MIHDKERIYDSDGAAYELRTFFKDELSSVSRLNLVRFDLVSSQVLYLSFFKKKGSSRGFFFRGNTVLTSNNFEFWLLSRSFALNIPLLNGTPK